MKIGKSVSCRNVLKFVVYLFRNRMAIKKWYDGDGVMSIVQVADVADDMELIDDKNRQTGSTYERVR